MRTRTAMLLVLGLVWLVWLAPSGRGDDGVSPPARGVDRAVEAMRREANAAAAAHERAFRRMAALPLPPAAPNRRMILNPVVVRVRGRDHVMAGMIVQRVDETKAEADIDLDVALPQFEVADETFNLYVYGSTGEEVSAQSHLERVLERKVDQLAANSSLTPVLRKKLMLAGRGDIKRLQDRVRDARKTFETLKSDVDRCADFLDRLLPLNREIRNGPFGSDSMIEKTFRTVREASAAAGASR